MIMILMVIMSTVFTILLTVGVCVTTICHHDVIAVVTAVIIINFRRLRCLLLHKALNDAHTRAHPWQHMAGPNSLIT